MPSHEREIDALFDQPPEGFTAARDRLARALGERGQRDAAREVKALRRPTIAAWAVNVTVRRHRDSVEALLDAARDLRSVQRRAASGVAGRGFAEAMNRRRRLVRELTERAGEVLEGAGRDAEPHLAAVSRTFEAAASHEESAEAVAAGRLSRELQPPAGFDVLEGFTVVPGEAAEEEPRSAEMTAAERDVERWRTRLATAREELRAAERERDQAVRREEEAKGLLQRARRTRAAAGKRVDRAGAKTEDAERRMEEAAARLEAVREGPTDAR